MVNLTKHGNYNVVHIIQRNVQFLGIRNDVSNLMEKSKIFVLPSNWEGLPMVLLEVMANGIPIAATSVGGVPEAIKNGKDGILVPPKNPEALANTIRMFLDNSNLQKVLAQNAYRKAKE